MHFRVITPTRYLDRFCGGRYNQFMLAQVALRDPTYFEWYKQARERGNHIIIDNGAYEGERVDPNEYMRVVLAMNVYKSGAPRLVVTLPDVLDNHEETYRASIDFSLRLQAYPVEQMWVLQAPQGNSYTFSRAYKLACVNAQWIAFPRRMRPSPKPVGNLERTTFATELQMTGLWRYDKEHYALGWIGDPIGRECLSELRELAALGFHSVDSGGPIWRGLQGVDMGTHWNGPPVNFAWQDDAHLEKARNNLAEVDACLG